MRSNSIAVVGAGIGGLAAALCLAVSGYPVTVFERGARAGGKICEVAVDGHAIDSGPTVFTLKTIFEALFARAGADFDSLVPAEKADILARHAWNADQRLDLFADVNRSADAIGEFSGAKEAKGFLDFSAEARRTWQTLKTSFVEAPAPSMLNLIRYAGTRPGISGMGDLFAIQPFTTLWSALGKHFCDPRLRQLFGRYSTYCGSSPFLSPATLMLVAHVEQEGVWMIEGGMYRLVAALVALCEKLGVEFRYDAEVEAISTSSTGVASVTLDGEQLPCAAVVFNGDASALRGLLRQEPSSVPGPVNAKDRSLSAMTWSVLGRPKGFALHRHTVFFSEHYQREFNDIFRHGKMPIEPTVYVCAQDRGGTALASGGAERLFCLINAPANGDVCLYGGDEEERAKASMLATLARCGLDLQLEGEPIATTPHQFAKMFPGSGGALYGRGSHGWAASFQRPGLRTKISGLYLAGGSVHPGPGIPMAALSGMMAAQCLIDDRQPVRAAVATGSHNRKAS